MLENCLQAWSATTGLPCFGILHKIPPTACDEELEMQWKGARLLYIKLQQNGGSAAEFASQPKCRCKIVTLVQLLSNPDPDPMAIFPLDVSASTSMLISRLPMSMVQRIMHAQMAGLLLGILIQLAFADSHCLAKYLYKAEALQLLHDIAMARSQHVHPDLQDSADIKQLRPDVHEKLVQIYRQARAQVLTKPPT